MRVSVERLRRWLLAGAVLLVVIIVGFLGYAHYRAHRFLTELPKQLGADIRQETNAYTWSQTVKGHTVFTVHAAKAIQHKDGKYTLHDVGIAVYGNGSTRGDRVDRIYGKEFDLDQAQGVVRATGEVHLDLEAPMAADAAGKMDYAAGRDLKAEASGARDAHEVGKGDARLIHVKTSGLVYLQKLGIAATEQDIEFEYNGFTGHAKGAEYDADTGVLTLQSAVKVNGLEKGQPALLTASRAELDRVSRRVGLAQAKYVTVPAEGSGGARQTVEARHATLTMRTDGSAERLEGEGGVTLTGGDGSKMTAERGEVLLGTASQPQSIRMTGHVTYTADDPARRARGDAAETRVTFDKAGHAERVVLNGGAHLMENLRSGGSTSNVTSERELSAATVELGMVVDVAGRSILRDAKASGDARLKVMDTEKGGKVTRTSAMGADELTATFVRSSGRQRLDEVKGDGRTILERRNEAGVVETSAGDSLDVRFRATDGKQPRKSTVGSGEFGGGDAIASAVQQGHVVLTRKSVPKPGAGDVLQTDTVRGAEATYDGDDQTMSVSGGVELSNLSGTMWADRLVMYQKTGDAAIEGSLKASYRQSGQGEMVHVLADRAELKKATDTTIFYGATGKPARLWQGGSQVEAPVMEFVQKQRRLVARGDRTGAAMTVRTVLVSARAPNVGSGSGTGKSGDLQKSGAALRGPAVVRIASREMVYSDEKKIAEFTGSVKVESADGVMRGQHATAYLQGSQGRSGAASDAAAGLLGGSVERVVVSGSIEIEQPGRRATGEQLAYTASDGLFVLTGTQAVPPRVMDETRGTVTGAELRFRAQDESVVISNGEIGGADQRVRTETRVKRER
jgi:lipopolysaccharide export system protein LptA